MNTSVRSVGSSATLALRVLVVATATACTGAAACALPLALADIGADQIPLAKAVRFDEPARPPAVAVTAAAANAQPCRGNLLLEGGFAETHWILATRYAFTPRSQADRVADPGTAAARLDAARRLMAAGEYETAQAAIEELVRLEPDRAEAHLALADTYRLRGDWPGAEAALQRGVTAVPNDPRPAVQLGELYVLQGNGEAALAHFTRLATQGPDTWAAKKRAIELLLELGRAAEAAAKIYELFEVKRSDLELHALHARMLLVKGDHDAGTHQLQEVLGQDFSLVRPRYDLALARARAHKPAVAAAEMTECLRQDPEFVAARYVLAHLHLQAAQYDLAHEQAVRVRAALPQSFDVRLLLTDVARGRGELAVARRIADELVREAPHHCDGHYRLGRVLAAQRQYDAALAALERALTLSPASVDVLAALVDVMRAARRTPAEIVRRVAAHAAAYPQVAPVQLLLGQLQMSAGDDVAAARSLDAAVAADAHLLSASYLLGTLHVRQGQVSYARHRFEKVAADAPTAVAPRMMLALIDEAEGRHDEAAARYRRILEIDPKFAPAANNLAWAYARTDGALDLALDQARRARSEAPDDPYVADTLGWILYRQRHFTQAITYLKEAAAALPDKAEVRYHLGVAYRYANKVELARTELRAALRLGGFAEVADAQRTFDEIDW